MRMIVYSLKNHVTGLLPVRFYDQGYSPFAADSKRGIAIFLYDGESPASLAARRALANSLLRKRAKPSGVRCSGLDKMAPTSLMRDCVAASSSTAANAA
jgi:hypothetical protein